MPAHTRNIPGWRSWPGQIPTPSAWPPFGERWQVPNLYADYRQMLADGDLDIVSVCVPTRAHAEVMQAVAASSVRGVFMEKPICRTLREADEMIAATDAAGIKVVVNHVRSFDPHFRRVRHLIASGAIGQVRSIMAHWHEGMSFGGSHFFDAVRHLLDAEPTWVFGHLDEGDGLFDLGGSGVSRLPGRHRGLRRQPGWSRRPA